MSWLNLKVSVRTLPINWKTWKAILSRICSKSKIGAPNNSSSNPSRSLDLFLMRTVTQLTWSQIWTRCSLSSRPSWIKSWTWRSKMIRSSRTETRQRRNSNYLNFKERTLTGYFRYSRWTDRPRRRLLAWSANWRTSLSASKTQKRSIRMCATALNSKLNLENYTKPSWETWWMNFLLTILTAWVAQSLWNVPGKTIINSALKRSQPR